MVVVGAGSGLLSLSAAAAGASSVTAVERSRFLYRMARDLLDANRSAPGITAINLVDRRLTAVGIAGHFPLPICSYLHAFFHLHVFFYRCTMPLISFFRQPLSTRRSCSCHRSMNAVLILLHISVGDTVLNP